MTRPEVQTKDTRIPTQQPRQGGSWSVRGPSHPQGVGRGVQSVDGTRGVGDAASSGGKVAAVQVVLSHHPNSEQDAQVQQVELVAGSRRTLLLTESTRVTSTGAKMVSIFGNGANRVLELDWANGLV